MVLSKNASFTSDVFFQQSMSHYPQTTSTRPTIGITHVKLRRVRPVLAPDGHKRLIACKRGVKQRLERVVEYTRDLAGARGQLREDGRVGEQRDYGGDEQPARGEERAERRDCVHVRRMQRQRDLFVRFAVLRVEYDKNCIMNNGGARSFIRLVCHIPRSRRRPHLSPRPCRQVRRSVRGARGGASRVSSAALAARPQSRKARPAPLPAASMQTQIYEETHI